MSSYVGIDVSKASLDVAILQAERYQLLKLKNQRSGFEKLAKVLAQAAPIAGLALEASGRYGEPVAHYLSQKGYPVSYLNPKLSKGFATRGLRYSKTDAQDAKILADYVRQERPPLWQAPSEAQRQLQQRSRRLETLKKMRQQEVNRLKSGLDDAFVREQIRGSIAYFEQLIHETEKTMHALIKAHPHLKQAFKLLTSIKGIGAKTAGIFLAEIGDFSRFETVKQLTAFLGMDVLEHLSGSSIKRPAHISKQGSARLRTALYMPALTAIKHNPACRRLNARLEKAHKPGKVRIVAVMRKLLHQMYGVLKSGKAFDPYYEFPNSA